MAIVRSLASGFLVVAISGCSLAITAPDPERPRGEAPKCDTGKGLVAADGLMATLLGVSALASFSADETGGGFALAAFGAAFAASAYRGNNAANDCRAAYDQYDASIQAMRREQVVELERPPVQRVPQVPVVRKQPRSVVPTEPQPPEPVQPPPPDDVPAEPAPEYTTPRPTKPPAPIPPAKVPPPKVPPVKQPAPPPEELDEDWSNFWKELP